MSSSREWNFEWPTEMIVTRRGCNRYLRDFGAVEIDTGKRAMKKTVNNHGKDTVGQEH